MVSSTEIRSKRRQVVRNEMQMKTEEPMNDHRAFPSPFDDSIGGQVAGVEPAHAAALTGQKQLRSALRMDGEGDQRGVGYSLLLAPRTARNVAQGNPITTVPLDRILIAI
jgi:hypothetical protein